MELPSSRGPWFIHSPQPPGVGLVESHTITGKAGGLPQAIHAAFSWHPISASPVHLMMEWSHPFPSISWHLKTQASLPFLSSPLLQGIPMLFCLI